MNRSHFALFFLATLMTAATTPATRAVVLNSSPFSFGYGFANLSGSSWNDSETSSVNTPTTQGSFSFTPAPVGDRFSGDGVVFPNRVLTDQSADGVSGFLTGNFNVPITANYNGGTPSGASGTPNYQLRLEISNISIYAGEHSSSFSSIPLIWDETTPGHLSSSTPIALPISNDFNEVAGYLKVEWNPDDFATPLANLNDPVTRTFDILVVDNEGDLRFLDGLEIEGRVSLIYEGTTPSLLGDYNDNGTVDAADYVVWRNNPASLTNEGASLGVVDQADYDFWRTQFGNASGSGSSVATQVVPEPASAVLLALALLTAGCRVERSNPQSRVRAYH
jgi:hypothetical protein